METSLPAKQRPENVLKAVWFIWGSFIILMVSQTIVSCQIILDPDYPKRMFVALKAANPNSPKLPDMSDSVFHQMHHMFIIQIVMSVFIGLGVNWFITAKILKGRNWARLLLLIGFSLGVLGYSIGFFMGSFDSINMNGFGAVNNSPLATIPPLLAYALSGYACVLLFDKATGEWFKKPKIKI